LRTLKDFEECAIGATDGDIGQVKDLYSADQGWLHCGPHGAGHFVKTVHNGIGYGLMAAYAEGLNIMRHANVGLLDHAVDAETTPLRQPAHYPYEMDLPEIAELWRRGSVIGSWLLDPTAAALAADPSLAGYTGRVSDSGEGRWTVQAAIDEAVRAVAGSPADMQIVYSVTGERRLTQTEIAWLPGYRQAAPVRVGSAAAEQFQLDDVGVVMDTLNLARAAGASSEKGERPAAAKGMS